MKEQRGGRRVWRREGDSNPRYGFPYTRVPGEHLQPLGHLSFEARRFTLSQGFLSCPREAELGERFSSICSRDAGFSGEQ